MIRKKAAEDYAFLSKEMIARRAQALDLLRRNLQAAGEFGGANEVISAADAVLEVASKRDLSILLQREGEEDGEGGAEF